MGIAAALLAGVGVGVAISPSESSNQAKIDAAVAQQRSDLGRAEAAAQAAQAAADTQSSEADDAMSAARKTQQDADAHALEVNTQLDRRASDLDSREAALAPREAEAARSTFGNGLHRVGDDINPGTYRTTGGSYCYWERLSGTSGEFDDIITNEIASGASVVTISASDVAFSSQDCGTWQKVG